MENDQKDKDITHYQGSRGLAFLWFVMYYSVINFSNHKCKISRRLHIARTKFDVYIYFIAAIFYSIIGFFTIGKYGVYIPLCFFFVKAIYELNHALSCRTGKVT